MKTIKSYTDIEQSRKLAEILPLESADMHSEAIEIDGDMVFVVVCGLGDKNKSNYGSPIWSLAALLSVLPDKYIDVDDRIKCPSLMKTKDSRYMVIYSAFQYTSLYDNPVDACVAMIEKLNELKLL